MEKITIRLEEKDGTARIKEPVGLGIPLPKGSVQAIHQLALMNGQEPVNVQLEPLAHWQDGSLRWVYASFLASLGSGKVKDLELVKPQEPNATTSHKPAIEQTSDGCVIHTSTGTVVLASNSLCWQVTHKNNLSIPSTVTLSDEAGLPCTAEADVNWEVTHKGPVFVAYSLKGQWLKQNNEPLARFKCELKISLETELVQVELTTHNPKRARHPGGLWDLGDQGSVYFQELAIETTLPPKCLAQVAPQATDNEPEMVRLADFNLYQDSSGGENWQSRNHIGFNGEISTQFCGYRLSNSRGFLHEGKRANPLIKFEHDCGQLDIAVPGFWQNFPTSIRKEGNKLAIGLLPKEANNACELQGGEQKNFRCLMAYSSNNSIHATAYAPLIPELTPECYEQADAFPWFKANTQPDALDKLISEGLDGNSNFFAKREVIDEFGWRNFGDIFADHESVYQNKGELPFISHYNNQYDPIYGFARQYALTGDRRWFQLMDDLARHVIDIDIYHTEEDRAEYNNGLFWHTDHYLGAHTATHRTFSSQNTSSSTLGQTGGGPAEEHCYTTGLLYHYFLTGNTRSRQAVIDLATWVTGLHEGSGTFFEQLLRIKRHDLPKIRSLLAREMPTSHVYLFNRGTGNYLNALLDAHILEPKGSWLEKAENVIYGTIHPNDQITDRKLLVAETGWSYLILLVAISRFLLVKEENKVFDRAYKHAADSLRHYTRWMLFNEQTFLSRPEELEFANDTWAAQDIRKAMIFFQAARWDPEIAEDYRAKAVEFLDYVVGTLECSAERSLARLQVILLQNYGPHQTTLPTPFQQASDSIKTEHSKINMPLLTWTSLISRIVGRVVRGFLGFRLKKELNWLSKRLERQ
jgi:hypothetical protein